VKASQTEVTYVQVLLTIKGGLH